MNRIFSIILSFFCICTLWGASPDSLIFNTCNYSIVRYYNGCRLLSEGYLNKDIYKLALALDSLDTSKSIASAPGSDSNFRVGTLKVLPVDTCANLPLRECFEFNAEYCCKMLDQLSEGPYVERPGYMRAVDGGECKIYSLRLDAKSYSIYDIYQRGKCQMLVLNEPSTRVQVEMTTPLVEINPDTFNEENVVYAEWTMPKRDAVRLRLYNDSEVPSTIILLSN